MRQFLFPKEPNRKVNIVDAGVRKHSSRDLSIRHKPAGRIKDVATLAPHYDRFAYESLLYFMVGISV